MFIGFVPLNSTLTSDLWTKDVNNSPHDVDNATTVNYAVYASGASMITGTAAKTDTTTGLYRYSFLLNPANGFASGQSCRVVITYVVGAVTYSEEQSFQVT